MSPQFQPSNLLLACATTQSGQYFYRSTFLGQSLQNFPKPLRPTLFLLAENRGDKAEGLSAFYNRVIDQAPENAILVFVHDDVYLHDWSLGFNLELALQHFDLVGLVGSSQVPYGQPGWWHGLSLEGQPVLNNAVVRSGSINHFDPHQVKPDYYGPAPLACDLLDGVFLAVRSTTLKKIPLRFDPAFRFHCYDTDFCYSARRLGLKLGTWPIAATHGSGGSFGSAWVEAAQTLTHKLNQLADAP